MQVLKCRLRSNRLDLYFNNFRSESNMGKNMHFISILLLLFSCIPHSSYSLQFKGATCKSFSWKNVKKKKKKMNSNSTDVMIFGVAVIFAC